MARRNPNPPPPGPGRPKGVPNKITLEIRKMIEKALVDVGGADYLARQADENPVAFMGLIGKILPKDVNLTAEVSGVVSIVRSFVSKPEG